MVYQKNSNNSKMITVKNFQVDNFNLKLNKFARYDENAREGHNPFKFFKMDRRGKEYEIVAHFGAFDFEGLVKRQAQNIAALLPEEHYHIQNYSTSWRLITGLGGHNIYETSITLHHIYGIPYIPASSIKGILRNAYINDKKENKVYEAKENDNWEEVVLQNDENFCDIFGCPNKSIYKEARKGNIIFFDAFPIATPTIEPDVMNPHYGDYYGDKTNKKPPADYYNPIPVFFLTIKNTSFQFVIGVNKQAEKARDLLSKTTNLLHSTLTTQGIGAKTAVGYGLMKKLDNNTQ